MGFLASLAAPLIGGIAGELFREEPGQAATPYLEQARQEVKDYSQPYINQGMTAQSSLNDIFKKLLENPDLIMKMLSGGYQESPGYQFNKNQGLQAIGAANAAGGMLGTPAHERQSADVASGFASRDFGDYMQRMLGLFGTGVQGTENVANRGFNASQGAAENLASLSGAQGSYAARDAGANNAARSNIFGSASNLLPFMFNQGSSYGGSSGSGSNINSFIPSFN